MMAYTHSLPPSLPCSSPPAYPLYLLLPPPTPSSSPSLRPCATPTLLSPTMAVRTSRPSWTLSTTPP